MDKTILHCRSSFRFSGLASMLCDNDVCIYDPPSFEYHYKNNMPEAECYFFRIKFLFMSTVYHKTYRVKRKMER